MSTTILVIIVIILLFAVVIGLYTQPKQPPYEVIQCSIEKITPEILRERQLVVISEPILAPEGLLNTLFAYQYIRSQSVFIEPRDDQFTKALSKYTLITSPFWDVELDVATPDQKDSDDGHKKYMKINLSKNQVVIVPPMWFYRCRDHKIKRITLDDPLSVLVYKFFPNA